MGNQLTFIQNQLWAVIALLVAFVATNIICYFVKTSNKTEIDFSDMWEKGNIEELINKAQTHLTIFPNDTSALFFCAKAYISIKQYNEAKILLDKLLITEPTIKNDVQDILNSIDEYIS